MNESLHRVLVLLLLAGRACL